METCYSLRSHHWTIDWPGFAWGNTPCHHAHDKKSHDGYSRSHETAQLTLLALKNDCHKAPLPRRPHRLSHPP